MLSSNTSGSTVRPAEDDWTWHVAAGHVVGFAGGVDDLIDSLESTIHISIDVF
jgi:hypothetical protein